MNQPIAAGKSSFDLVDAEKVFAALELQEDSLLLDLACGVGRYALAAAERVSRGRIYAVDLWAEGIAALRQEVERRELRQVEPVLADVSATLPLADASVDAILMATVLHDLLLEGSEGGALREAARVLRPGGRLVVVEFKKIEGPPGPPAAIRLAPEQTEALVSPFGFERDGVVEVGPYNYLLVFRRMA